MKVHKGLLSGRVMATLFFIASFFSTLWSYQIGPGDVLDIQIWHHEDLSMRVEVSPQGKISLPLLGDIYVLDKTPEEVDEEITRALEKDYLNNPQVFVTVKEYNSKKILILGEVGSPGEYKLKGDTTLLEALTLAGGISSGGKIRVIVARLSSEKEGRSGKITPQLPLTIDLENLLKKGDWKDNITLRSGDVVYVTLVEGKQVHILGEVKRPGSYKLSPGMTVLEAVLKAGGFTEMAATKKVRVIRESEGKRKILYIDMNAIIKGGGRGKDISLAPGDIVYVPTSFW